MLIVAKRRSENHQTLEKLLIYLQKQPSRGVLGQFVTKICSKVTREQLCPNAVSIKLLCTFTLHFKLLAWMLSCRFAAYFQDIFQ